MTPPTLCVVGNINRDIKPSPLHPAPALFEDGETVLDGIIETIGGGGANSACVAAALGAKVSFMGKVGRDALGAQLRATLRRAGVRASLATDSNTTTGTSIALSFTNGHRHFISALPNNASLTLQDLRLDHLARHQHLLRADIWFSEAMLFGGNEKLFRAARRQGLRISVDLNWDPAWGARSKQEVARRKQAVREILPLVDLVHGNIRELNEFAQSTDLQMTLGRLLEWGAGGVVLHLGTEGSGYFDRHGLVREPADLVTAPVEATGSGDVFSVAMILSEREAPIQERLKRANQIVADFMSGRRSLIPRL